jgi:alkylhydroperoxidase/carboxymuconolactone decarboxylase family protein YurZ
MPLSTEHRELVRRLTLNDERVLSEVMSGESPGSAELLDERTRALVRFAGLIALDSETASLQAARDASWAAGAVDEEIVDTVVAVAPIVGTARVDSIVPRLSRILGSS